MFLTFRVHAGSSSLQPGDCFKSDSLEFIFLSRTRLSNSRESDLRQSQGCTGRHGRRDRDFTKRLDMCFKPPLSPKVQTQFLKRTARQCAK